MEQRRELHIHPALVAKIGGDRSTLAWAATRDDVVVYETASTPGGPHRLIGDTRLGRRRPRDASALDRASLLEVA